MYNTFRVVQYPQWSEQRTRVCTKRNVASKGGPWYLSRDEVHQGDIHYGVMRVLVCGDQGNDLSQCRRCCVIPRDVAHHSGGALPPWPERFWVSSGIGKAEVLCYGVISVPRGRLNYRGDHRRQHPAAPRVRYCGCWRLQCRLSGARGERAVLGDRCGPRYCGSGGHECSFNPTAKAVVEGRMDVEHAPRGTRGVLLDLLYPGNIILFNSSCVGLGVMAQHRSLLGSGLPPWSRACQALTLPREEEALSSETVEDPRRSRRPQEDPTTCLWIFEGPSPRHFGRSIPVSCGSHQRPGNLFIPGLYHIR